MEFEQIVKRLEWLDKQQRENKEAVTKLTERLTSFESNVDVATKQIKTASKQLSEITPVAKRMEQFEALLTKQRADTIKLLEDYEKTRLKNEKDATKRSQAELDGLNKTVTQLKATLPDSITQIKKELKERSNEMQRALNNMSDLKDQLEASIRSNEDVSNSLKAMDETRKNDLKRVSDLQGEITAIRKRVDEGREKNSMQADSLRNIENRFTEFLASETERRQAQTTFLDQQAIAQIDRDRAWKDWKEKYDSFQSEAAGIETRVQTLDEALRNAKKAQETYLDLNTKLERRINEVTEMQRLAEDRLRQEWVSFKADDQKRWTGYSLSSEESFRDIRKDVQKVTETITTINDVSNNLQDAMHQTTDVTEKQLQELMNAIHEWMTSYQRIMGHGKKTKKT
jgi:chromosome segregation ATPase